MAEEIAIKDFSYTALSHPFRIGDDVFHALPDIPFAVMGKIVELTDVQSAIREKGADSVIEVFTEFLQEDSASVFKMRVAEKKIGVKKITEILPWILEKYGVRPTQPSSDSSDGSDDGATGASSTDGAPQEESIL